MLPQIHFFAEDIDFPPFHKPTLKKWLAAITSSYQRKVGALNYIFCSDAYLHQMNVEHLGHDTLTDIITFDNSEPGGKMEGDIFISVDRVAENAAEFGVPVAHELHRVMAHGTLHLLGLNDKSKEEKEEMRTAEDTALLLLATLQSAKVKTKIDL
jgi:probable rRNA maturation factor